MFRLYEQPRTFADYLASGRTSAPGEQFYERKRLLTAFAARKHSAKRKANGKAINYTRYLTISALSLDTGSGACSALREGICSIYERRPLACRTVPFHYSRPEASAESDLEAFVATPGYCCDTTGSAPVVLKGGRIVDALTRQARNNALTCAERDRRWQEAILRRMNPRSRNTSLPGLREIEADAAFGASTTSMHVAWQIAAEAGVISKQECATFIAAQAAVIDRELTAASCTPSARETLVQMRSEYRQLLSG